MFGDPFQHEHMKAGIKAAAKSKKTPAHLKPHLEKRLKENTMAVPNKNAPVGQGGRFAAMVKSGKSPALAAFIGRKKYGNAKMAQMSAAGRKSSDAFRGR
jgi:hypothetical protein